MRHPFIVNLNYAFQTKTKLFLILDFCPGGDLGKIIANERRFTEDRARLYISEVLLALKELHRRDIIYRDLKPDNVVLDDYGHALLTDFGLSKEGVLEVSKGAKSFCGSIAYLAPEMLRRVGHGKSVDWYLLGVLLYEMLVGTPPYFSGDKQELFNNIIGGPLKLPKSISTEAKNLMVALLNRNPTKRLGSGPEGALEIMRHPFFKNVDWDMVLHKQTNPPRPRIRTEHFNSQY
jgi:serine/threonine protein kinase